MDSEDGTPTQDVTALAPSFVGSGAEFQRRMAALEQFVRTYLREGEDYGLIPGTRKPTLFKSGAEKLCDIYGFTSEIIVLDKLEDWERGRFSYTIIATLRSKRTGLIETQGIGNCNSLEARYRYVWLSESRIPPGTDLKKLPHQRKKGDRGSFTVYRVPTEDPFSQVNTILKMAKKRALVDAVLSATRSSGLFSQDVEDLRANGVTATPEDPVIDIEGPEDERSSPARREAPAARPSPVHPEPATPASPPARQASFTPTAHWSIGDYEEALRGLGMPDDQIHTYWVEVLGPTKAASGSLTGPEYLKLKKRLATVLASLQPAGGSA